MGFVFEVYFDDVLEGLPYSYVILTRTTSEPCLKHSSAFEGSRSPTPEVDWLGARPAFDAVIEVLK